MGTKNNPGRFDCHAKALPDEPVFTLLARDPDFYRLVMDWAQQREFDVWCGRCPPEDMDMVKEARQCALDGQVWRRGADGKWRNP